MLGVLGGVPVREGDGTALRLTVLLTVAFDDTVCVTLLDTEAAGVGLLLALRVAEPVLVGGRVCDEERVAERHTHPAPVQGVAVTVAVTVEVVSTVTVAVTVIVT